VLAVCAKISFLLHDSRKGFAFSTKFLMEFQNFGAAARQCAKGIAFGNLFRI
jgi:hypothetical protein